MPGFAPRRWFLGAIALIVAVLGAAVPMAVASLEDGPARTVAGAAGTHAPPPRAGYFHTRRVGSWSHLPGGRTCAQRIHRSTWEPRPQNAVPNHWVPAASRVHRSFAARPVAVQRSYDKRWDRWLLQRVTGHHTGTTDEIIQWAACKWGLPDNLLRAVAVRESTWYQNLVYRTGRCVPNYGCGDMVTQPSSATRRFCTALARFGHDYTKDRGSRAGVCPRTFGIAGVMSWQAPSWGRLRDNQNGTFPFNRRSTAFSLDYLGSQLRGCYEGWEWWLRGTGTGTYRSGDLWGCVGAWYSGDWHSRTAAGYIARVRKELARRTWLSAAWPHDRPGCSRTEGCPRGVRPREQ
jgi:hypothetical protein